MKALAMAAALLLGACASEREAKGDVEVYVEDVSVLDLVREAASEWNACGGRKVFVRVTPDTGAVWVHLVEPAVIAPARGLTIVHDYVPVEIRIAIGSTQEVYSHEVGHVLLGGEHFGGGLMMPNAPFLSRVGPVECARLLRGVS